MTLHRTGDAVQPAPWHAGERQMQTLAGMREAMENRGRVVLRDHMPEQHRQFFVAQERLFAALLDARGQPWATIIEGGAGLVDSPSATRLEVAGLPDHLDVARTGLEDGAPIGILGLQFETRRRNRINGKIDYTSGKPGFAIDIIQCFGNCAKYIHSRQLIGCPAKPATPTVRRLNSLDAEQRAMIEAADTFFIASRSSLLRGDRSEGLDVSHRGGPRGFVRVVGPSLLCFPDYAGNAFFNTLGNLQLDPRCGLLFVDFANGRTLQIAGQGTVLTEALDYAEWPGAQRAVAFDIDEVIDRTEWLRTRLQLIAQAPEFQAPEFAAPVQEAARPELPQ